MGLWKVAVDRLHDLLGRVRTRYSQDLGMGLRDEIAARGARFRS